MISSDAIQRKINGLLSEFSGRKSLNELFPPEFVKDCSSYTNAQELFEVIGVTDQDLFDAWLATNPDEFISEQTSFGSWKEMFCAAGKQYANNCLAARRNGKTYSSNFGDPFDSIMIEVNLLSL